jgi:hypothetical protein
LAPAIDAVSMASAAPARMRKRRMKKSPAERCDASRESKTRAVPAALGFYAITSRAVPDFAGAERRRLTCDAARGRAKDELENVHFTSGPHLREGGILDQFI